MINQVSQYAHRDEENPILQRQNLITAMNTDASMPEEKKKTSAACFLIKQPRALLETSTAKNKKTDLTQI